MTSTPGDWGNKRLFDGNLNHYYNTKHGNTGFHTRPAGSGEVVTLIVDTLKERYLRYVLGAPKGFFFFKNTITVETGCNIAFCSGGK